MNRCKNCNVEISDKRIYCSLKCRNVFVNTNLRDYSKMHDTLDEKISNRIREYYSNPNTCVICGKSLSFESRHKSTCSIECRKKYHYDKLTPYKRYHKSCQFNFSLNDYPEEFDFNLIEKYGWYKAKNRGDNLNGVSRDHMISIKFGFENNIDPMIISHPANCNPSIDNDNVSKFTKCSLSIDELIEKIKMWNTKYKNKTQ